MAAEPIIDYTITDHAAFEISRRGLKRETIDRVLKNPEQRFDVRLGRVVLQSRIQESGEEFLIRVFVDADRKPAEVVTAYRTTKIGKYWRA
ncbi:MAG: DUF4258 domain-containing protein [Candidatus Tectomicrobia bacterium]